MEDQWGRHGEDEGVCRSEREEGVGKWEEGQLRVRVTFSSSPVDKQHGNPSLDDERALVRFNSIHLHSSSRRRMPCLSAHSYAVLLSNCDKVVKPAVAFFQSIKMRESNNLTS